MELSQICSVGYGNRQTYKVLFTNYLFFIMQNSLVNNVTLIGNLGAKPTVTNLDKDKKVSRFSMATTEFYNDAKGAKQSSTTWHNIVTWGRTAEIVENYLDKGQKIAIQGKIINRSYETKDGEKKFITEIQANDILMLGNKAIEKNEQAF